MIHLRASVFKGSLPLKYKLLGGNNGKAVFMHRLWVSCKHLEGTEQLEEELKE